MGRIFPNRAKLERISKFYFGEHWEMLESWEENWTVGQTVEHWMITSALKELRMMRHAYDY